VLPVPCGDMLDIFDRTLGFSDYTTALRAGGGAMSECRLSF